MGILDDNFINIIGYIGCIFQILPTENFMDGQTGDTGWPILEIEVIG